MYRTNGYQGGREWSGLRDWDWPIHTTTYIIND